MDKKQEYAGGIKMEINNLLYFLTYSYRTQGFLMFSDVIFEENYTDAQKNYTVINKKLKDHFEKINKDDKYNNEDYFLFNLVEFSSYLSELYNNSLKDNKKLRDTIITKLDKLLKFKELTNYLYISDIDKNDDFEPFSRYSKNNFIYSIPKYVQIILFRIFEESHLDDLISDYMLKNYSNIEIESINYNKDLKLKVYRDKERSTLFFAKTIKDIKDILEKIAIEGFNANYFRGHSQIGYPLIPGIYRSKISNFENKLSEAIINHQYREFNRLKHFPDYLSLLQHYGTPTRLLDITSNYKVAAYFASLGDNKFGEIFLFNFLDKDVVISSDRTANILSSIALMDTKNKLSIEDKYKFSSLNKSSIKRGFIKLPDDVKFDEFQDFKIILDSFSNNRVFSQKGSFILFGINFPKISIKDKITKRIIILDKPKIQEELEDSNINQLYLFPELDKTCEYFKAKYSK
jgi:hypothetical protein